MTELLAAAGILVTVLLAYVQIQKQHRSSLRLQEEHLKNELKVKIYHEISDQLDKAGSALSQAAGDYRAALMALESRQGKQALDVRQTSNDLQKSQRRASKALIGLLTLFEKYEIVFSHFSEMRGQLADEQTQLREANFELTGKLTMYLPREGLPPETQTAFPLKLRPDDFVHMKSMGKRYLTAVDNLQGYILDIQVEAQNELLGNLFGRAVPPRNPEDPDVKVLKRDANPRSTRPKGHWV